MTKILCLFFMTFNLEAAVLNIQGQRASLSLGSVQGFKLYRDFLGLPFVLIEQESEGKKSSLSIIPTGLENLHPQEESLRNNYGRYEEGRRRYAKRRGLTNLKFLPPLFFSNKSKARIVSSGYEYRKNDGTRNLERSFFLFCPKEAFHLKLLTQNDAKGLSLLTAFRSRLRESRCEG